MQKRLSSRPVFQALEKDHRRSIRELNQFYEVLRNLRYEGKLHRGRNLELARRLTEHFRTELLEHMSQEEKVLFPFLNTYIPRLEPVVFHLSAEHADLRKTFKELQTAFARVRRATPERLEELCVRIHERGVYLICLLRSHMSVESQTLYDAADHELRSPERERLLGLLARG